METTRRELMRKTASVAAAAAVGWRTFGVPSPGCAAPTAGYGPLGDPDVNGVRLPSGFSARLLARTGEPVLGTNYVWHPRARRRRDVRDRRRGLGPRLQQRGQREQRRRLGDPLRRAGRARLGLPDPLRHEVELRRRRDSVGHVAVLRGVPQRSRVGVRPVRAGPGVRPAGTRHVHPRGLARRRDDGLRVPDGGRPRRPPLPLPAGPPGRPVQRCARGGVGRRERLGELVRRLAQAPLPQGGRDDLRPWRGRMDLARRALSSRPRRTTASGRSTCSRCGSA